MFSADVMINILGNRPFNWLQYRQVHDLVNSLSRSYDLFRPLNEFETWVRDMDEQNKLLSKTYKLKISFQHIVDMSWLQWQMDLGMQISCKTWDKVCFFNYKFSLHVAMTENCYKVLHRWYLTPFQLPNMHPN